VDLEARHVVDLLPDRSGLALAAAAYRPTPTVSEVSANAPAAAAGLRPGDVLVTVDSRPAADFGVDRLTRLLTRPGTVDQLVVQRRGTRLARSLRL
jgi:S1-C subfamily serine protease